MEASQTIGQKGINNGGRSRQEVVALHNNRFFVLTFPPSFFACSILRPIVFFFAGAQTVGSRGNSPIIPSTHAPTPRCLLAAEQ